MLTCLFWNFRGSLPVSTRGKVDDSLYLKAPRLDDYEFKIIDTGFPITSASADSAGFTAQNTFGNPEVRCTSMDEFTTWLRTTLSPELVAGVIGNLMKLSRHIAEN